MPSSNAIAAAVRRAIRGFLRTEEGQDLLEYGLLVTLIAIVALGAVSTLGQTIFTVFWKTIAASV
jgi:Flp pilus assembly pilin Flp